MKPVAFDYAAAADSGDALRLLSGGHGTKIAAGSQSLGPMLNLRLARPARLVDVSLAADLRQTADEGDTILYGAATTHAEVEDGVVPDATGGWLTSIARGIAYRAVRNRGTMGGSLAHADPAADWVVTLTGLGAEVVLLSATGTRSLPVSDFITGPLTTALAEGEMITGIRIAKRGPDARWGYWKFTKKRGDFAKASATVLIDPGRNETRIVVGAIERAPIVLPDPAAILADPAGALAELERLTAANPPESLALHAAAVARAIALAQSSNQETAAP
ncbi:Caffeine dehydrogenase subunit beta [Hartmannibacter diazotrophicus]|uniref:Caffeine dehydrogenase subunit beta n=1 Tax=Hartmannibacter diazotrophicus TaxID=1482074 RepID=A0A2C9D9Z2_9HYPH|nr:FAD binding domain-containing protein [Hartmannibacter diazotrophicus]SON56958.1 Caffeine dehydrogenase subunit beta [Hartmannibacter diazotrophicus]